MTNERIIFNEVCTHYDALQRHDLASRFYTAEQVERYAAGLKFEPDGNGNTPDPVEAAEAFLCSKLFHTWAEWHNACLLILGRFTVGFFVYVKIKNAPSFRLEE